MSTINYLYHSVEPDAVNNAGYTEFDTLDFSLAFPSRAMVAGSIRVEGELQILNGAAEIVDGDRVSIDHMIGAHALVQSCVSSTLNAGVIENITNLPRFVAMKTNATKHRNDMCNSEMVCELRSPDDRIQQKLLKPRCPADIGGGTNDPVNANGHRGSAGAVATQYPIVSNPEAYEKPDFSFKPHIVFNNVVGVNKLINYSTTGDVKISLNLGRNAEVLFGADMSSTMTYKVFNMRVCFTSVPEPPKQSPVNLRASLSLKSNLNSTLATSTNRVPAICDSCSISFMELNHENNIRFKNSELEPLPNVDAIRFNFNSSTNKYLAYELKTKPEIISEGLKALSEGTGSNNVTLDKLAANKGMVAGLKFGEFIDLSKQRFSIQIASGILTASPYVMYAYFHSLISI